MEIEKAKEINSSSNWKEVQKELDFWIKAEESRLRNCPKDDLEGIQANIKLLERIKNLPQIVIDRES